MATSAIDFLILSAFSLAAFAAVAAALVSVPPPVLPPPPAPPPVPPPAPALADLFAAAVKLSTLLFNPSILAAVFSAKLPTPSIAPFIIFNPDFAAPPTPGNLDITVKNSLSGPVTTFIIIVIMSPHARIMNAT